MPLLRLPNLAMAFHLMSPFHNKNISYWPMSAILTEEDGIFIWHIRPFFLREVQFGVPV
jgi:hypothetical protein